QQIETGNAGGAGAIDDQLEGFEVAAGELQRVEQAGGGNDGGAVLVVVEDGDVEQLLEPLLDDEAIGSLDGLKIDTPQARTEVAHAVDDRLDGGCVDEDVDGIDIGKALKERALAFHHRLGGLGAQIAEAENGRTVGDHGH